MAKGIPFSFAHHNPDFHGHPETLGYCLVIPGDETQVNMNDIELYLERISADSGHTTAMHRLAAEYMDYGTKVRQIVAFIKDL